MACYLTTGKHMQLLLCRSQGAGAAGDHRAGGAGLRLSRRDGGAVAASAPLRWLGKGYIAIVRGVPDIAFFLFFVIALDQFFEWIRHEVKCPDWTEPIRQGNDFIVCPQAKLPLGTAPQWVHETYGFFLAVLTFAIVFGAFAANVLIGAMRGAARADGNRRSLRHVRARPSGASSCRRCGSMRCRACRTCGWC
jgi:polar amino acid transport system permease protein